VGTRERLAFALMLYTGQRRSDVHRMTWADINGDSIRVTQQKTGAKLVIPLHKSLREVLAFRPRNHVTILNTLFGKPFSISAFSGFLRASIEAAGRTALGRPPADFLCLATRALLRPNDTPVTRIKRR
jgi:enterobacteria phage integrase